MRHEMEILSTLLVLWESTTHRWISPEKKNQQCEALIVSVFICRKTSRVAVDLRRHNAHATSLWWFQCTWLAAYQFDLAYQRQSRVHTYTLVSDTIHVQRIATIHPSIHPSHPYTYHIKVLSVSRSIGLAAPGYVEHWLSMHLYLVGQRQSGHIY